MAALQTLRNKPVLLMSIIGAALLLFIVTLVMDNRTGLFSGQPNKVGEVFGEKLTYEDYQQQIGDEQDLLQVLMGQVSDKEKEQISDRVWNNFVRNQAISREADKLGLQATDEDVQNAISQVTVQELQQIMQMMSQGYAQMDRVSYAQKLMLIVARLGGQPSAEGYKAFLKELTKQLAQAKTQNPEAVEMLTKAKAACLYCEKMIKQEVLYQKYFTLFSQSVLSNPVSAKMNFEERTKTYNVVLATLPYASIADDQVKVADADLKAVYDKYKPLFRLPMPSRDIKLIDVAVAASQADQTAIMNEVQQLADTLATTNDPEQVAKIMKGAKSEIDFQNVYYQPQAYTQSKLGDIADALPTMQAGQVQAPQVSRVDEEGNQYITAFKLLDQRTTPDSMQVSMFVCETKAKADSIVSQLRAGKAMAQVIKENKALADKYQVQGDTTWVPTNYYVAPKHQADSTDNEATDLCQLQSTGYYVTEAQGGTKLYIVAQVLQTKAPSAKYNVAVVRYPIKFSQPTYNEKKRKLGEFLAANTTIEQIEKNASAKGYTLTERPNFTTSDAAALREQIGGTGASDAFKWAFDEADKGQVSDIFECGKNSDHLLVVLVADINTGDYLAWDNANVRKQLEPLALQEKKAEKLLAQCKNVKTMQQAAKLKNVQQAPIPNLTVAQVAPYDPAVAGLVARTAKGKFGGPVRGAQGITMVQVNNISSTPGQQFNAAAEQAQLIQQTRQQTLGGAFSALMTKAGIDDRRYHF